MLRSLFSAAALAASTWAAFAAVSGAGATEPQTRWQFRGPEVTKLDWNTRALVARDLDGDGLVDLALINNDNAAFELLYQTNPAATDAQAPRPGEPASPLERWTPQLEDAHFRKETLIVGQNLFDLAVADFNGDGRADLAATGEPAPLLVRYAQPDGTWEEKTYATAPLPIKFLGCLSAADIDDDGLADLVILGQKEIAVFRQKAGAGLVLDEKIALADDNAYGLVLTDLNGDGRPDLTYLVAGHREALRVRHQVAAGKFGPELAFTFKTPRSPLVPVASNPAHMPKETGTAKPRAGGKRPGGARAYATRAGAVGPLFASAVGGSGQVEFTRLAPVADDDRWRGLSPRAFAPLAGAKTTALYAAGDLNGDGSTDLAVAYGETAQIFVYPRHKDGSFTLPYRVSSLTDARAIGALPGAPGEGAELFVLSGKENALARIRLRADDGVAEPARALPMNGRLITFGAGELVAASGDGNGQSGLAVVAEEDGKRQLTLWTRGTDGVMAKGGATILAGLRADPRAVFLHDLNQDGRTDVLVSVPAVGVRAYLQKRDGQLVDAADSPLYRAGLLARADAATSPLSSGDVDGDGRPELLVAAENFIRALRLDDASGELMTVAQFETRDSGAEVTTGFVLPGAGKDAPLRVILHDKKSNQLHLLEKAAGASVAETLDVRSVARLDVIGALRTEGSAGRSEFLLLGKDRFWWMPEGASELSVKSEGAYASDLPDVRHTFITGGDFDGDGDTDLLAVDINENTVELIARDHEAGGVWRSRMHFRVFEKDPHFEGNRGGNQEPREAVVADVTGDGRLDLVLLVHDRVLVYPQE